MRRTLFLPGLGGLFALLFEPLLALVLLVAFLVLTASTVVRLARGPRRWSALMPLIILGSATTLAFAMPWEEIYWSAHWQRRRSEYERVASMVTSGMLTAGRSTLQPEAWKALEDEARRRSTPARPPLLTTTDSLGIPIRRVIGVVGSEYVMGVHLIQEFLAGVRDIVGGRSQTIQTAFGEARETLLHEISDKGRALRADAVLGIAFTVSEWSGQNKSMLVLLASGTAVELDLPSS